MGAGRVEKIGSFGIRRRILLFVTCATLVPSLLLGWVAYFKTHQLQLEKTEYQLLRLVNYAAQSLEGLLQQRLDELNVFANSPVVRAGLEKHQRAEQSSGGGSVATAESDNRLTDYLELLMSEVDDYRDLLVTDMAGQLIAQTSSDGTSLNIPVEWLTRLTQPGLRLLPPVADSDGEDRILVAVPVDVNLGVRIGFFAGLIPMGSFARTLQLSPSMDGVELALVDRSGGMLAKALPSGETPNGISPDQAVAELFLHPGEVNIYHNRDGRKVAGLLVPATELPWGLVIEADYASTFAEVDRLRDIALAIMVLLLLGFGLLSFLVSRGILVPLKRLTGAAAEVAEGNLAVRVNPHGRDELGFAITVFNDMVTRLRASREQLERLTVTDPLTGLFTRNHILEVLGQQLQRFRRNGPRFSILMADLDHFKRINDQFGHLAGDAALERVGKLFLELLRSIDSAARYGGEEFLIILEQTGFQEALLTAERIRAAVESTELVFEGKRIQLTISIGVATVSEDAGRSAEEIVRSADRQLYRAKECGRNCVMPGRGFRLATHDGVVKDGG